MLRLLLLFSSFFFLFRVAFAELYFEESEFIGSEFSRTFINKESLSQLPVSIREKAFAIGKFGLGTAFYLGEKSGRHYMFTAAHTALSPSIISVDFEKRRDLLNSSSEALCRVYAGEPDFGIKEFYLPMLNAYYLCKQIVYLNEDADVAIFEISVEEGQPLPPSPIKIVSAFDSFKMGSSLAALSASSYKNIGTAGVLDLTYVSDSDCKSFGSPTHLVELSSESYLKKENLKTLSLPVGCDFVAGDSGAPVFNIETGQLVGSVLGGFPIKLKSRSQESMLDQFLKTGKEQKKVFSSRNLNQVIPLESLIHIWENL